MRRQYRGNAHGLIAGIGLVNRGYVNPDTGQFWLIGYRLFAPDADGRTEPDEVADMLARLIPRGSSYRTVPMAGWYATTALFAWLTANGKRFCCPLKWSRISKRVAVGD